jgi:hypothetical protein
LLITSGYFFWGVEDRWPGGVPQPLSQSGRATIYRSARDGSDVLVLARNVKFPQDFQVADGRLFWTSETSIGSVRIDGSDLRRRVTTRPGRYSPFNFADGSATDGRDHLCGALVSSRDGTYEVTSGYGGAAVSRWPHRDHRRCSWDLSFPGGGWWLTGPA